MLNDFHIVPLTLVIHIMQLLLETELAQPLLLRLCGVNFLWVWTSKFLESFVSGGEEVIFFGNMTEIGIDIYKLPDLLLKLLNRLNLLGVMYSLLLKLGFQFLNPGHLLIVFLFNFLELRVLLHGLFQILG